MPRDPITLSTFVYPQVGALLEHIGLYIDPLNLLRRLPEGMQIPKLRDRLVRIVADYRAQTSLRDGCNNILRADCAALSGAFCHIATKYPPPSTIYPLPSTMQAPPGGATRSEAGRLI
eukprot:170183-Prorocentrum_minimum.AAC.2